MKSTRKPTRDRPKVLHLGYEDPRKPGAGGGSVRTAEINARLAEKFDIHVVCAPYPGCAGYVHEGVRYSHAGLGRSYNHHVMSYFALQPAVVARNRPDLVVEDFGAPLSTWGLPWLTRKPVVGVVQWLFAEEKSSQYGLPFQHVERHGLRTHRTLIAVSDGLGARLATRNPRATVHVVPNGLPAEAFTVSRPAAGAPAGALHYLGRLDDAQKGIGLMLEAYAAIATSVRQDLVVAGEGPDGERLKQRAVELGVQHRVHFTGSLDYSRRFDWLASADAVLMPSRYETFGMVAAESLAAQTPVVAFDIECLRELVDDDNGRRVPAFDVTCFAGAILELCSDPELRRRLGAAGRQSVSHLTWDNAAEKQARVYQDALESHEP